MAIQTPEQLQAIKNSLPPTLQAGLREFVANPQTVTPAGTSGSVVPPVAPAPAPSTTPILTPTPTRYTPPTSADIASSTAEQNRLLAEQHEKQRQETMTRINAQYDTKQADLMAQQRAINYNRGQVGAETGNAAKTKVNDAVRTERGGAISQALQSLDDIFYKRSQDVRSNAMENAKYDLGVQETLRANEKADKETAKEKLTALGAGNATVDTLKTLDAKTYQGLADLGFGDVEIDAYLTAGRTEENKVKVTDSYQTDEQGNAVLVRTKFDPITGTMSTVKQPMGIPFSTLATHEIKEVDGQLWDVTKGADNKMTLTPIGDLSEAQKAINAKNLADANAPKSSGGSSLTPYQQFTTTQALAKDTQARTEKAREMVRQASIMETAYNNYVAGGDKNVATQAIVATFNKVLDPTSVVREGEYDRTAKGQSLIGQIEGKARNIVEGGNITPATLKAAVDLTKEYLKGAQQNIVQQNQRAEQMAVSFGLNPDYVVTPGANNTQQTAKTIDDYKAEFPQASMEELQALMAEEQ